MNVQRQPPSQGAAAAAPPTTAEKGSAAAGRSSALKGMSYEEGVAALAPPPAEKNDKLGAAKGDKPEAAKGGAPGAAKGDKPAAAPGDKPPVATMAPPPGVSGPWYIGPPAPGLPPGYAAQVPPGQRKISTYTPVDPVTLAIIPGAAMVQVWTTIASWQAWRSNIEQARYQRAKADADAATLIASTDIAGGRWVASPGPRDINGVLTYDVKEIKLKKTSPGNYGFVNGSWITFQKLDEQGWPPKEIQMLANIKPGHWNEFPMGNDVPPIYDARYPTDGPVPTKYALAHLEDIKAAGFGVWYQTLSNTTGPNQ